MNKHFARIFVALLFVAAAVLTPRSVSARPVPPTKTEQLVIQPTTTGEPDMVYPGCSFGPLNPIGPAPLSVHFDASGSRDAVGYAWYTADETATGGEVTFDHVFKNEGTYKVRLTVFSAEDTYNHCTTWVTVLAAEATQTPQIPVPSGTPNPVTTTVQIDSSQSEETNMDSRIQGDHNVVIGGDHNQVQITIEQVQPTVTPTPVQTPEPDAVVDPPHLNLIQSWWYATIKSIIAFWQSLLEVQYPQMITVAQ